MRKLIYFILFLTILCPLCKSDNHLPGNILTIRVSMETEPMWFKVFACKDCDNLFYKLITTKQFEKLEEKSKED